MTTMYIQRVEKDVNYGLAKECEVKSILQSYFNVKLTKLSLFHPLDFMDETLTTFFEIKSRRLNHDKYNTMMIGKNKIEYIEKNYKTNNSYYFIFVCVDGIFYYKYDKEDKLKVSIGGRNDRGKNEYKHYYYIPVNKLIKIIF